MLKIFKWFAPGLALALVFYLATSETPLSQQPGSENSHGTEIGNSVEIASGAIPQTPAVIKESMESVPTAGTGIADSKLDVRYLYKWRDSENIIVISSYPPPDGITAETFIFSREAKSEENKAILVTETNETIPTPPNFSDAPLRVYSPEGLKELIEYSKEVGEKIQLRGELLNELVEQL